MALREAMSPCGGRSELQHRMHLDPAGDVGMRPEPGWSFIVTSSPEPRRSHQPEGTYGK